MNEDLMGLIWLVVLLATNAFFVGAEFAVISARRSQIEPKADAGNALAKITLKAMEQVSLMLATAQLGITVSSLLILVIAEPAIHHLLEIPLSALGLGYATTSVTAFVIALLLVTYLHVVLGEMLPKNFAIALPDKAALILGPAIYFVAQAVRPLVWTMNQISNLILKLFGFEPRDEANTAFTLGEVEGIVEESTKTGVLQDKGGTITKAFEFTEKRVLDITVPIDQLVSLPLGASAKDLQELVSDRGFSRFPVVQNDELLGYWHLKDSLIAASDQLDAPLPHKLMRAMISIPQTAELEDALAQMRKAGAHIARSFSPDGTVVGCVFLEDIIEELVGEIEDATRR